MKKLIETIDGGIPSFYAIGGTSKNGIWYIYANEHEEEIDGETVIVSPLIFLTSYDVADDLDRLYYLTHSGEKKISSLYERFVQSFNNGYDDSTVKECLMEIIVSKFADKWNKLYSAMITSNYDPLENYNMEQTETPNVTKNRNVNSEVHTDNDVYGFNSGSTPTPVSETTVHGDKLKNEETETETGTRDLTRHGNIGVTTSQQMLISEIELRDKYNFYEIIMNDMDSILCLLTY